MADGAQMQPLPGLSRAPRSIDYTLAEREIIIGEVLARLAKGEPLAAICRESYMPCEERLWAWSEADESLAKAFTRARDQGFDCIALEALEIADGARPLALGDGKFAQPDERRDRLRVDTRLRLLAKWDPKRYGEAVQMRMADANGEKLDTTPLVRELLALVRPAADGSQAAPIEGSARVIAPDKEKPSAG